MKPAAVFITGDFIYHANPDPQPEIKEVANLLLPLQEAQIPTYAVLGNHDYRIKNKSVEPDPQLAAQLEQKLKSIGSKVLNNEAVAIPLNCILIGELASAMCQQGLIALLKLRFSP